MMTKEQIQSYFNDVLKKLWPKWKTNDVQIITWSKELKYLDFNAVKRATEEHFTSKEGSYGRPKLPMIVELAKKYQPRLPTEDEPHGHIIGFYLQRVTGGYKVPFYIDAKHRNNYDVIMRAAELRRQQAEALYGDKWLIIQAETCSQIQNSSTAA